MIKTWKVFYLDNWGIKRKAIVETRLHKVKGFITGTLMIGDYDRLYEFKLKSIINNYDVIYDLSYEKGDLHKRMIFNWFGEGLIKFKEIKMKGKVYII